MGWQATGWAFRADIKNPGAKFVLVALAERAGNEDDDADFWFCFPSIETISKYTSQGYRTIQRHLDWLEEDGWIRRTRRQISKGKKGAYDFTLVRARGEHANLAGGQNVQNDLPKSTVSTGQIGQTEPVIEPSEGTSVVEARDLFAEWWAVYPRKVAKENARQAWAKTPKGVDRDWLIGRTREFAEAVKTREPDKIPHAATWLNGKRWEDHPEHNGSHTDGQRNPASPDRGLNQHNERVAAMQRGAVEALKRRGRWGSFG